MKGRNGGELVTHSENRRSFYSKAGYVCLSVATIGGVGEFVVHTMPEAIILGGVAVLGLVGSSYSNRQLIDIDHDLSRTND